MSDRENQGTDGKILYCSFCGKSQHEVRKLIAGPNVYICDECVELCNDIIREELEDASEPGRDKLPKPQEINEILGLDRQLFLIWPNTGTRITRQLPFRVSCRLSKLCSSLFVTLWQIVLKPHTNRLGVYRSSV